MDEEKQAALDRRTFLKGAAATAGAAASATVLAQSPEAAKQEAPAPKAGGKKERPHPGDVVVERPGSDFMVDVIKTLDFEYLTTNPGSSFRSIQESLVNYGGNKKPELLTCMHEEAAIAMAHGYAKATGGKPMAALVHGTVGLQHGSMAIYNAWVDRVPIMIFTGNGADAVERRPGTEWNHAALDVAALVRDFVKWDDSPASLGHFAESTVRAYKIATTPPMEPVLINCDIELQEHAAHDEPKIPRLARSRPPQGDRAALAEAAKWLAAAEHPVIIADRCVRNQDGVNLLVQLAEALQAPVVDLGNRMNFPSTHPLCQNEGRRGLVRDADVVLLLEVSDSWGQFNSLSDPHHHQRFVGKQGARVVNVSMQDVYIRSNYQDFQRYWPADLAINGDAQASLPTLLEEVRRAMTDDRRRVVADRGAKLKEAHAKERSRARNEAAIGWDLQPITTARLAAETWNAIKGNDWCLATSDRIPWARRLWPTSQYHHMLGGSGAQGVGYCAPGSLGVALANKSKGILTVTFQPDGDLMYSPGVLWTAAYHKIPLLFVMHNNRAYHQETMHVQRMAGLHKRRPDTAWVGTIIDNPPIDFAKLAQSMGVWAEGPVTDPANLGAALKRAVDVVKRGEPALVDVICQGR